MRKICINRNLSQDLFLAGADGQDRQGRYYHD